ncbi:Methyl sulfide methyltransferase-associated sensor [uncultured archaeon]|nr:Methyl sulfide methyltransferase-associated sensor [uncultured archaeon]
MDALVVSTPQGDQVYTLKGAERPYRVLMEKMKEGAVTLSEDNTIFYCNQGFADMLRKPLEKMIGIGISQFVSSRDRPFFNELLQRGRAGSSKGEVTFLAGDGTVVPVHLSVNTMLLDGLSAAYLVATDITERKRAEEALQKAHDELEIKVQDRTRELVEINEQLNVEIGERKSVESRLTADLAALNRMHALSGRILEVGGLQPLLQEIIDAAVAIMQADRGTLQLLESGSLRIVAHHGHQQPFLEFFASAENQASACGDAMMSKERVIVPDVEKSPLFVGTPSLATLREAGVRAVQSTPMISRTGVLLGILTTQWCIPYSPDEHDLWRIDLLARQVADLIEYSQAEKALRESEQRHATTLSSIGDAVIVADVDGRITFMNAVAEALTGWTLVEALAKPVTEVFNIMNEDTRSEVENPVIRVLREGMISGLANHTILVRKDGTEIPIDDNGAPIRDPDGRTTGAVLVFRDITERKRVEEALAHSNKKVSQILESITDGFMAIDNDWRFTYINQRAAANVELEPEDLIGQNIWDMFPAIRGTEHEIYYRKAMQQYEPQYFEMHGKLTDKSYEIRVYPSAEGISVFWQDITERKRIEEALRKAHDELELHVQERTAELQEANKALRESEASYRELTESIDDPFYAMDSDLRYTYWNKASEALTGISAKDAIGKSLYELFSDVKGTKAEKFYIKSLKMRQPERLESEFKLGDKKFIFEINSYPTGTGLSVIAKDITEKKMLEAQLLRAQRMESIGTLAGGIAHDLNNMLTPMMLSLQMLREKFKDESSQKLLAVLEQNTRRGADLIKQVLSFTRGVEGERNHVAAAQLISEIEKIAKVAFPRNIEIITDIKEDLFPISGDATQLHQVIMNLCVNARDAMPEGGTLSISAENSFIDENYVQTHIEARAGSYVVISVSDTGTGIPPRILDRIFDPFFTTKEFGKGTGLGLPTALTIVKSHGGFIDVQSVVGKGTTFKVYLPAALKTEKQGVQAQPIELIRGNGETILIVDDEAPIRETTCTILEDCGYKTIAACDGVEAVLQYTKNRKAIKLVLIDMSMPVMDGPTCIRALLKIDPDIKIIAVSGLIDEEMFSKVERSVISVLRKPYTAENLLENIHKVWLDTLEK